MEYTAFDATAQNQGIAVLNYHAIRRERMIMNHHPSLYYSSAYCNIIRKKSCCSDGQRGCAETGGIRMNIAVCDDVQEYRTRIVELLEPYRTDNDLQIREFSRGEDVLSSCREGSRWDIVFLDIEMDGITGIETGLKLRKIRRDVIIIFVTNHINYVSDAFRLDAFQFLLKPVEEKEFRKDFERALRRWRARHKNYQVKWRNTSRVLEYNDILYMEAYDRHLYIHTEKEAYECVGKLQEEYEKLKPCGFAMCHQGYMVNLSKVAAVDKTDVILKNGTKLPVSRRLHTALMEEFNLYVAGKLI